MVRRRLPEVNSRVMQTRRRSSTMNRRRIGLFLLALLFFWAAAAFARVGGGHSYSGGSSSSSGRGSSSGYSSSRSSGSSSSNRYSGSRGGGGSGMPGAVIAIVMLLLFVPGVIVALKQAETQAARSVVYGTSTQRKPVTWKVETLRQFDPNFSRAVFEDFCYALYAHVHHARGTGDLARYAPYLSDAVRRAMAMRNPKGLTEVRGIVIGAIEVGDIEGLDAAVVMIPIKYDANITEVIDEGSGPREVSWYLEERWFFERRRDILSPPPAKAKAEHCPRCGAVLQTRTDGSCEYCGVRITDGQFQWFVRNAVVLNKDVRGPLLTSNVEEQGTDLPTIRQRDFLRRKAQLETAHPGFNWDELINRVRQIAGELQAAWSARDWERVRPVESDALFQTHRYWIDAYIRQHLRNIVDGFQVRDVEAVKIDSDAFYDAITFRIRASGRDYTADDSGKVVAGSARQVRTWSEYWTFIRTRGAQAEPSVKVSCPNCGAAVVVGPTGTCSFCKGKLTSGEFGWVLSRIEQDEAYVG